MPSLADQLPRVKFCSDAMLDIEHTLLKLGYTPLECYLAYRLHTSLARETIIQTGGLTEDLMRELDINWDNIVVDWKQHSPLLHDTREEKEGE